MRGISVIGLALLTISRYFTDHCVVITACQAIEFLSNTG